MGVSFELEGFEAIQRKLVELGQKGKITEKSAVRAGAEVVLETMKKEVPVSNVHHVHIVDDLKMSGVKTKEGLPIVEVGPGKETSWRAKFIEFGTVKLTANPFISRSVKLSRDKVKSVMKNEMKRGLGL